MSEDRHYKRTGLFLVRVWVDKASASTDSDGNGNRNGNVHWKGKVQRVVDGESNQFDKLQDLPNVLLAMLSDNEGR